MTDEQPDKPEDGISESLRREIEALSADEEPEPDPFQQKIEELERKGDSIKTPDLPKVDDFDDRLRALEDKAQRHKEQRTQQKAIVDKRYASDRESAHGLGIGLTIAYSIIGLPLFGYGIGWLIDRARGTENWKGYLMLLGAVAGVAMAFVMLNRNQAKK